MNQFKIRGGQKVSLGSHNFIASGGEGDIYVEHDTCYKICQPGKMILEQKIQELSVLNDPRVIRPLQVIEDTKNHAVGYTMRAVKNASVWMQCIANGFWTRNHVTPQMALQAVLDLQQLTRDVIHHNHILVVDYNEMNFMIADDFKTVYAIDVNSYQTKSFPATALMESIRDRHSKTFNQGTDWFGNAILSFELLIGMHPFKGKHPKQPFSNGLDWRMQHNISILNSEVSYPSAATRPVKQIPSAFMDWFKATFERGKRDAPPINPVTQLGVVQKPTRLKGVVTEMEELEPQPNRLGTNGVYWWNENTVYLGHRQYNKISKAKRFDLVSIHERSEPLQVFHDGTSLFWYGEKVETVPFGVNESDWSVRNNKLFSLQNGNLLELDFVTKPHPMCLGRVVGKVMNNATMQDGCVVESLLGKTYVWLLDDQPISIPIPELNGLKLMGAKYSQNVLVCWVVNQSGQSDQHIIRFSKDFATHDHTVETDTQPDVPNFAVLSNGLMAWKDGTTIKLRWNRPGDQTVKIVQDNSLAGLLLSSSGDRLLGYYDGVLYRIKIK